MNATEKVLAKDLVLGDAVKLLDTPYGWGTVVQITDEEVHVVRPYTHIGDFSYTGGVLHYTGVEMVKLYRLGPRVLEIDSYTRKVLLETPLK